MKKLILPLILSMTLASLHAQEQVAYWQQVAVDEALKTDFKNRYSEDVMTFKLDMATLKNTLSECSRESGAKVTIEIPKPDGSIEYAVAEEASVMHHRLQDRFPEIRTYIIRAEKFSGRASISPFGFHLMVFEGGRTWFIDPVDNSKNYVVYRKSALLVDAASEWRCHLEPEETYDHTTPGEEHEAVRLMGMRSNHIERREYRTAIACTGEYTQFHGGTVPQALAAMVVALNRINTVYERELAIRLIMIEDNDKLIFLDPDTDPYNNNSTSQMLGQNQTTIDNVIGSANYDIGHVFATSAGGVASLGSVCTSSKARGVTGLQSPVGDPFVIDYVAHELGHQFGGNHTFNNCDGNENFGTAFEPGSGSTIMAYAGLCGTNNVQFSSDDYFHVGSLQEMTIFSRLSVGNSCATRVETANTIPEIQILSPGGKVIPINTPFELEALAVDSEDQGSLVYCWEQYNTGPQVALGSPTGTAPSFRSNRPGTSPKRTFPAMNLVLAGSSNPREVLPDYTRNLSFRCSVRDQHPEAGAHAWAQINFSSNVNAGPFRVSNPALNQSVRAGSFYELNWDVANTDIAPVNCSHVDIILSRDRGVTWTDTLEKAVPNSGNSTIWIPIEPTNNARIRINANDHIFFNVNPGVFNIELPSESSFSFKPLANNQTLCLPGVLQIPVETYSLSGFEDSISFEIIDINLPSEAVVSFSENPVKAGTSVTLHIDLGTFNENQEFEFIIEGRSVNDDTLLFPVKFNTFRTLSGDITPLSPENDASGISPGATFVWDPVTDVRSYRFQLDTNPAFLNPLVAVSGLAVESFSTGAPLDEGKIYFWKVSAENTCSLLEQDLPFSFQVQVLECESFQKPEDFFISASGTPVYFSDIAIVNDFEVSSVEIHNVTGNHQFFSDLDFSLLSPASDEISLIRRRCGNFNGAFDFGFSDFVTDGFGCPPNTGRLFMPTDPLNAVAGISTQGTWRFRIRDNQSGSGGRFTGWTLRLCAAKAPDAAQVLSNTGLVLKPAGARHISMAMLNTRADNVIPEDMKYLLVGDVQKGKLFRDNFPMEVGSAFTQADINQMRIYYAHYGSEEETDLFTFVASAIGGGWTGQQAFQITMDDDFVSGTHGESISQADFEIYPNPASDRLFIHNFSIETESWLIYNLSGKVMKKLTGFQEGPFSIDISDLPPGLYFIQSRSPNKISNRSFVRM